MTHKYFNDEEANNEIDAVRAACEVMTENNLWMFAQRSLIAAVEAQEIIKRRFPQLWRDFDRNVITGAIGRKR